MLKKIVLVALFVVSATIGATGAVFAHPTVKAPVPAAPKGFCPMGIFCV
jgi:hypothetical protein